MTVPAHTLALAVAEKVSRLFLSTARSDTTGKHLFVISLSVTFAEYRRGGW